MVGGRRLALTEYAERRGSLKPGRKMIFAARHPILELTYRAAGKELEKAEAGKKEAVRTLAHLTHDINNVLTGIQGTVELLKIEIGERLPPDGIREGVIGQLSLLLDACHRIMHVTNTAMELSGTGTSRMLVDDLRFDAATESERVVRHMSVLAKKKGLALIFEGNVRMRILSDHRLFDRVLSNIVGNAIKYTTEGSVSVSVAREGADVAITVGDTGPGMGKEELRAIFNENYRGAGSNCTSGKGLGLYIAKTYTERMGGKISVESEPGKGSVFTLRFRAAEG